MTGLEPGTNFPNHISFERRQGRVVPLAPGKSWSAAVTIAVHNGREEVTKLESRIRQLQGRKKGTVLSAPDKALSP